MTIAIAIALGLLLGILAAKALFLGWWTLVPWGVAGLALGYACRRRHLVSGAVYGFVLCFTFMVANYTGAASVLSRVPFFAIIGLFGALCGLVLTYVGQLLHRKR